MSLATVNNYTRNLRVYFNYMYENRLIKLNPMKNIKAIKTPRKVVGYMADKDFNNLLKCFDLSKFHEYRDYVITQLIFDTEIYTRNMKTGEYLFKSRKGENRPITTVEAYRIISEAAKRIGLEEIGTHTMRKTFGYWHYQQYKDVAILQEIFNHSSPSVTLRYIGINQDNIDKSYMNFSL